MTSEIQALTLRIEKLERQNRRLVRLSTVVSILLASFGMIAAVNPKARTVEAEQFIVRDANGHARLTLGTPSASGVAVLMKPDEPAIWLSDPNGLDRAIITADGFRLSSGKGKPVLEIGASTSTAEPASIRIYDSGSKVVWSAP